MWWDYTMLCNICCNILCNIKRFLRTICVAPYNLSLEAKEGGNRSELGFAE